MARNKDKQALAMASKNSIKLESIEAVVNQNTSQLTDMSTESTNLVNGLRYWRSKLANVAIGNGKAIINIVCDSIGEGYGSDPTPSNWINTSYTGRIRNALATKYGDVGRGIIPTYFPKDAEFMVPSGFTTKTFGLGFANYGGQSSVLNSSFTFTFYGTGVEIFYVEGSGAGDFTYQIDGGAVVPHNTTGTLAWAAKLAITGLSNGTHTCVIKQNQSGTLTYILGFAEIKGTNGVQVNMVGKESSRSAMACTDKALLASLGVTIPDLTIIEMYANDFGGQETIENYTANIQKIITKAKAGGGDVLITTIGMENIVKTIPQLRYHGILKSLAQLNNCAFLDMDFRWKDPATAVLLGFINVDDIHLSAKGSMDAAIAILKIIDAQ